MSREEPSAPPRQLRVDAVIVTHEFAECYRLLRPSAKQHCSRAIERLQISSLSPAVQLTPLPTPAGYFELRVGYSDRAILRLDGTTAILIGVFSFREIARWNALAGRRIMNRGSRLPG